MKSLNTVALIPARYASTRFPAKLLQEIGGKSVILRTYENIVQMDLFQEVYVVCDHEEIYQQTIQNNGKAILSKGDFESGTDRIASVLNQLPDAEIIVNVQGDEPFTKKEALRDLLEVFEQDKELLVASLMHEIKEDADICNPNQVKVVVDCQQNALLFSRSVIPYHRNKSVQPVYYKHIGIYAFRREMLLKFATMPPSPLEQIEQLEGMRYLENGIQMKMVLAKDGVIGIDTPEDLEKARIYFKTKI